MIPMSLERFFIFSLIIHAFIIAVMIFYKPSVRDEKKSGEFLTSLVTPEEYSGRTSPAPAPKILPLPPAQRPVQRTIPTSPVIKDRGIEPPAGGGPAPGAASPAPPGEQIVAADPKKELAGKGIEKKPETKVTPLREKLFDRSVIGDLAKRDTEREAKKKDAKFSFDAEDYKFLIYNRRLKERIESIWIYPPEAAAKGIYGDLVLRFTIRKNGKLGAIELVRTSGHRSLDDAAMKALKDGEPYWPLPDEWNMDAYIIEGRFVYTIYGYFIR
jgi:periplasmic protein TonB